MIPRRPALLVFPALAIGVWSLASMQSGAALDRRQPNVLFVVWNSVRADRVGCCGAEASATPRLDEFAADALVFERAYTPAVGTLAAHASLFTGLPASAHGVGVTREALDARCDTLAERFAGAGYATYLFTANPLVSGRTGLDAGFECVERADEGPWSDAARQATLAKLVARDRSNELARAREREERDEAAFHKDAAPVAARAFLEWLDGGSAERPFFACLDLAECSAPRAPSMEARCEAMPDADRIELGLEVDPSEPLDSEDARLAVLGVYDASLRELDRATGELFDELGRRGMLDDTVVVLTSDCGEALGERGRSASGASVHEELARVPLVLRCPRRFGSRRETRPVSTLDVYATLVNAAGLARPFEPPASIDLTSNARPSEGPVFVELLGAPSNGFELAHPDRAASASRTRVAIGVVEEGWKLVSSHAGGASELYELASDPRELHDLAPERPEDVARLQQSLDDWSDRFGGLRFAPDPHAMEGSPRAAIANALRRVLEELEPSAAPIPPTDGDAEGSAAASAPVADAR